jgi:hypothetical protein
MNPNIALTHITSAAAFAYLLILLQKWSKTPWITVDTKKITILLRVVFSILTEIGIAWTWSGSSTTGWHIGIDIPSLSVLVQTVFHAFGQYALQHGWFNVLQIQESKP